MFMYGTFCINTVTCLTLFAQHACLVELELKHESKDPLLVAFVKTNPQAKKPCMSSLTLFLSGKSR
jgi:hypothetical protein